jgi:hypothetical protein
MRPTVRSLLVLLCSCSFLTAADPALVNLSRPDVNFVMGIHVSKIASSPLVAEAMGEAQQTKPDWDALFGLLGPQPFRYLDEIVVSARLDPESESKKPENLLIVARGVFGDRGFSDFLCAQGCDRQPYKDLEVLRAQPKGSEEPVYFSFLDSQYAVLGQRKEVEGAIDRRIVETHSIFSEAIQEGVDRLGNYDIWLAAKASSLNSPDAEDEQGPGQLAAMAASKIDGFGLGFEFGKDVEFALELRSVSPAAAKELFDMAQGFLSMMKAGKAEPDTQQMLDGLRLRHEGNILAASLHIPEAEVRRQMHERAAKHRAELAAEASAPQSLPTRPRREGGIRIYGLKEKPVEVPTTTIQK